MRTEFANSLAEQASRESFIFMTGDLGYLALEPLQAALGDRFINAGISEQNMVSTAAGLAKAGMDPWVYSIAPFLYARAFEQIRIDVALHDLPVRIVGNGGGYHYGVMGSTHHAIEDYGALLTLQNMRVYVPAFSEDVPVHIDRINADKHPLYFRLGRSEKPADFVLPEYAPWRRLVSGSGPTLLAVGPLVGGILKLVANIDEAKRPTVWVVSELPCLPTMPAAFLADVARSESLFVVEEHVKTGSVGQEVAAALLECGGAPSKFRHFCAKGYPTGRYGSQEYHREESGINAAAVVDEAVNG